MIAQRVGATALRRVAKPESFFTPSLARALVATTTTTTQTRPVSTEQLSSHTATSIDSSNTLASQRLRRPVSPNLGIYDIQQTWLGGSAWTRITGCLGSGTFYIFGAAYLIAPLTGWHLESASLAAAFGSLPLIVKGGLKFLMGWPVIFHCANGVRHLWMDLGYGYEKAKIRPVGWGVWGAAFVSALGFAFFY